MLLSKRGMGSMFCKFGFLLKESEKGPISALSTISEVGLEAATD